MRLIVSFFNGPKSKDGQFKYRFFGNDFDLSDIFVTMFHPEIISLCVPVKGKVLSKPFSNSSRRSRIFSVKGCCQGRVE